MLFYQFRAYQVIQKKFTSFDCKSNNNYCCCSPHRGRRLIINRETGPGSLSFTAHEDIQVHIHASNEVPYTSEGGIKETVYYGSVKEVILSITEMVNDASVEDIKIQNRRCRFPWELPITQIPHHYNYYSHSTCMTECSIAIQIKYCNCTHHLMPRNSGLIHSFIF